MTSKGSLIDRPLPRLRKYSKGDYSPGRGRITIVAWVVLQALFFSSWLPGSFHRRWLLRFFGATVGTGVVIKPRARVKFPWRLEVGDFSWIGEAVWIDNLAEVSIGRNCCISQNSYLCCGSHDWMAEDFRLVTKRITIEDGVWIGARAVLGPGIEIGQGSIVTLGSIVTKSVDDFTVFRSHLKAGV